MHPSQQIYRDSFQFRCEKALSRFEDRLSTGCAVLGINLIAGPTLAVFGILQAITGLGIALLGLPVACVKWNFHMSFAGFQHIGHGIANTLNGAFSTIPLVGTVIWIARNSEQSKSVYSPVRIPYCGHKFWPYESIIRGHIEIPEHRFPHLNSPLMQQMQAHPYIPATTLAQEIIRRSQIGNDDF